MPQQQLHHLSVASSRRLSYGIAQNKIRIREPRISEQPLQYWLGASFDRAAEWHVHRKALRCWVGQQELYSSNVPASAGGKQRVIKVHRRMLCCMLEHDSDDFSVAEEAGQL